MRLFIDYFTPEEREGNLYVQSIGSIKNSDIHYSVNNKDEFLDVINGRDLNGITHITILTHGVDKIDYICKDGQLINAISYLELVNSLNTTINGRDIKLNLTGICESLKVIPFIQFLDERFAEIWISEVKTPYLLVPITMVYQGFDYFIYDKDDEDIFFQNISNTN